MRVSIFQPYKLVFEDFLPLWQGGPTRAQVIEGIRVGHVAAEWDLLLPHIDDWSRGRDDRFLADLNAATQRGELDEHGFTRDNYNPASWS